VRDRFDQHFLRALGVLDLHRPDLDLRRSGCCFRHGLDRVRLVRLDADVSLFNAEDSHQDFESVYDLLRPFEHQAMVGSEIGFALGAVEDHDVDGFFLGRTELHVGRERGPSHADDASLQNDLLEFLRRQQCVVGIFLESSHPLVLAVAFNDNSRKVHPERMRKIPERDHLARDRGMDRRRDKSGGFTDLFSLFHFLSDHNECFGWRSEMLTDGLLWGLLQERWVCVLRDVCCLRDAHPR